MASLAVSVPKRFVMPRSSSFTSGLSAPWEPPEAAPTRVRSGALGLARRLHRDRATDDVGLDLLQLGLEVGGHLGVELVERGEAGAVVLQVTDVVAGGEGAARGRRHVRLHGAGQVLRDARDEVLAELGGRDAAVGVDPDQVDLAARRLRRRARAEARAARDREDHVRALLDERLADLQALVLVGERARERAALLVGLVPAEHLDVLALLLVVVLHALVEAVHVDRDGRDVQAAPGRDLAALR